MTFKALPLMNKATLEQEIILLVLKEQILELEAEPVQAVEPVVQVQAAVQVLQASIMLALKKLKKQLKAQDGMVAGVTV